jgi:competence protein ComEA
LSPASAGLFIFRSTSKLAPRYTCAPIPYKEENRAMRKITALLLAAAASLGLAFASTGALAQAPKDAKKAETKADAKKPAEAPKADTKKAEPPKAELMDINTATEKELASLKGIGDVRAKAIIKNRPYKGKDEIVTKAKVPQKVYDDIKDQIIAKQDMAMKADAKKAEPAKKAAEPMKKADEKKK